MTQSGTAILEGAQARGLPCCCALELADTVASEQVRTAEGVTEEDGILRPADPIVVDGARRPTARPPLAGAPEDQASTRHPAATPSRTQGSEGPLAGVRVLDVSQIVSGPYAGHLLAALGAEVIMVESRSHLVSRGFGPFAGEPAHDASSMFNQVNRGKRSVQLNLATEEGRGILFELAGTADVVLENFSRRAADRLGLTHAALRAVREDIILASISGFGRSGPWGDYVALHSGVILLSGLASVTRDVQGAMRLCGAIYPDLLTGSCAALAIQQAIAARERSGRGCHLELSMLDVMLTCMGGLVGTLGDEPAPPARFLPTTEPTGFLAVPAADASAAEVAGGTRRDAMARLQAGGVPAAAVLTISEVMQDPHLIARDFVGLDDHPVVGPRPIPAVAWQYDGRRSALRHAPLLGEGDRGDHRGAR